MFIKYRASGTSDPWEHATLSAGGHLVPADGMGAFIYRNANSSGTFSLVNTGLNWYKYLTGFKNL